MLIEAPSLTLAFVAGLASFVSPCCLPLVPGYLAAVFGRQDPSGQAIDRRRVLGRSLLFVSTFSLLFIALGLTSTVLGQLLFNNQPLLNKVGGATMVAMGALFVASPFVVALNGQWRPRGLTRRAGGGGSPVVAGAAFAIAWTPCVGPTLGAILGLAATGSTTGQGALLLALYSAGLAVPFVAAAVAYERMVGTLAWFKRHYTVIQVASGLLLVVMGVLVYTGELFQLNLALQDLLEQVGLNFWKSL